MGSCTCQPARSKGFGTELARAASSSLATHMLTAIGREIPPNLSGIPKVLDVFKQNGMDVAA